MHLYTTRPVVVDPATVRVLSTVVPCPLCTDGLCSRCWRVASVAVELTVACRRDQATDDPAWAVAA